MILSSFVLAPPVIGRFASTYTGRPWIEPTGPSATTLPVWPAEANGPCAVGTISGRLLASWLARQNAHLRGCMTMWVAGMKMPVPTCWIASAILAYRLASVGVDVVWVTLLVPETCSSPLLFVVVLLRTAVSRL